MMTSINNEPNTQNTPVEFDGGESTKWKAAAKITGYVNLLVACIGLVVTLIVALVFVYVAVKRKMGTLDPELEMVFLDFKPEQETTILAIRYVLVLISAGIFTVDAFFGYGLVVSLETDGVQKCLIKGKIWIYRNFVLSVLPCVYVRIMLEGFLWPLWIWLLYRGICLVIGCLYFWELHLKSKQVNEMNRKYLSTSQPD